MTAKKQFTPEEIKKVIKDKKVEFIKLQFCDINGTVKNMSVPVTQIDKILIECFDINSSVIIFIIAQLN